MDPDWKGISNTQLIDFVQSAMRGVTALKFDWNNQEGLPVRADARDMAVFRLFAFSPDRIIKDDGLPEPRLRLETDGTITIVFVTPRKAWMIRALTYNVVKYALMIQKDGEYTGTVDGVWVDLSDEDLIDRVHRQAMWLKEEIDG